jgi:hypothetical protein
MRQRVSPREHFRRGNARIGIIAVFVGRDHQHAEPDDFVELVGNLFRHTRVGDAARHPGGDAKPLFDLP